MTRSSACKFDAMNYTASAAQLSMSTSIHFTARMNKLIEFLRVFSRVPSITL